jgi:RNA polymerase sigma-70 factor (ECF subfamily)
VPEPAAREENQASRLAFQELLATLPEGQREVLMMLKVGGLSLEEVARATSSTVGAVKQKAHRAYERLRSLLLEAPKPRPARIAEAGVTSHLLSTNNKEGTQ